MKHLFKEKTITLPMVAWYLNIAIMIYAVLK